MFIGLYGHVTSSWFIDGFEFATNERMLHFSISTVDASDNFFIWNVTSAMQGEPIYFTFSDDGENFNIIGIGYLIC